MIRKTFVILAIAAIAMVPMFTLAGNNYRGNRSVVSNIIGEPCLVPVYHTEFAFPPEGGQIIQTPGGQLYFVRTYMPGCADAGRAGTIVSNGSVVQAFPNNQQATVTTTYHAPQSGKCY